MLIHYLLKKINIYQQEHALQLIRINGEKQKLNVKIKCISILHYIFQYNIELKYFEFEPILKMQNNSLAQIKLKANEFIEDYERQITQRQYKKQKLKQNIMLQIMSNRNKTSSQSCSQDSLPLDNIPYFNKSKVGSIAPVSQQRNLGEDKNIHHQFNRSNSVPNALRDRIEDDSQQLPGAQITFKMAKNKQIFNVGQKKKQEYYQSKKDYDDADHEYHEQDYTQTLRENNHKQKISKYQQSLPISKSNKFEKQNQSKIQKSQKFKAKQPQVQPQSEQNEHQQQIEELQEPDPPGPIFLTVEENQSMDVSQEQKKKNYTFDIVMDKSEPIEDIDQLRKKKIQQMQKKRQLRMQEFRKQEQAKKNSTIQQKDIKRSNSSLRASNRISVNQNTKISDDLDSQKSRSKSRKKINPDRDSKTNLSSQNIVQESHYNMKPPQPQRGSYLIPLDKEKSENPSRSDYNQTPKTISSQYRVDKSKGKNTIFRQSPKRADKSTSKYSQQPKIEPKQRKNTFSKQSNKKLMISALANVCLPGQLNRKDREKLTQVIQKDPSQFFVFLFKQYSRKVIKAIYVLDASQSYLQKIYGQKAPQQIISQNVQSFYRFDSGSRQFKKLDGCKSFSLVVHAIDLA